jgi:hypothetical protein
MNWRRKLKKTSSTFRTTDGLQLVAAAESLLDGAYEQHLRRKGELNLGWSRLNGVPKGTSMR